MYRVRGVWPRRLVCCLHTMSLSSTSTRFLQSASLAREEFYGITEDGGVLVGKRHFKMLYFWIWCFRCQQPLPDLEQTRFVVFYVPLAFPFELQSHARTIPHCCRRNRSLLFKMSMNDPHGEHTNTQRGSPTTVRIATDREDSLRLKSQPRRCGRLRSYDRCLSPSIFLDRRTNPEPRKCVM